MRPMVDMGSLSIWEISGLLYLGSWFGPDEVVFRSFFDHFLRLCAIHIRANSISTFSSPLMENLLKRLLLFIWPKTASTSMGRLLRWYFPVSEFWPSLAFALSSFKWLLSSFRLLPLALWHCPRMRQPSQRLAP